MTDRRPSRDEQLDAVADILAMVTAALSGDLSAALAVRAISPHSADDLLATATGLLATIIAKQAGLVGREPLEYVNVLGLLHAKWSTERE